MSQAPPQDHLSVTCKSQLQRVSDVWYPLPIGAPAEVAAYIDGLFDDEIRGWAVDVDQPDRLLTLCIRINGAFAGKVTACHYRGDLVPFFGSRGLHGFAFRVSDRFFSEREWSLEVLLEDGRYLPPRPLAIADPAASRRGTRPPVSPCLLFIHVPKAAGTALRNALTEQRGLSRQLFLYPHAPGFPGEYLLCLTESQLANLECVYGHFGFRLHKCMPQPCEYATVLREPIARTLSHFFQLKRSAEPGSDLAASLPADEFFAQTSDADFDNLMTRLVSGDTADVLPFGGVNELVFQHALENLHQWFNYVGIQDDIHEVQRQLAQRLHLPLKRVERENIGEPQQTAAVSKTTLEKIERLNEYDKQLYRYVRENFWTGDRKGWIKPRTAT